MTAAPSMAEVVENHAAVATGLGEWCCKCSPREWRPLALRHRHVAQALAAAGFGHVASVEAEVQHFKGRLLVRYGELDQMRVRAEAAEARLAAVRDVLAEHWDWKAGRVLHAAVHAALDGEATP